MADNVVEIPFKVAGDLAVEGLHKIEEGAHKLAHTVDHLSGHLTNLGAAATGMLGGFGFERMIETGKEYLDQVDKMTKLTGVSANNVAGMRHAFELAQLGPEQLASSLTAISKKSAMLQEGGKGLVGQAKQWGIDMEHGPEKTLISMSKLVEKHKIGAGQVAQILRVGGENLGNMMDLLKQGPKELTETLEEGRKKNGFVNDETIEAFARFDEASVRIHQSWTRLSARVVTALAPALEKLSDKLSGWMDSMGDNADVFGQKLAQWMELGLKHAKEIGKILAANALLQRMTGQGLAGNILGASGKIVGLGGRIGKGAVGLVGKVASPFGAAIAQSGLLGRTFSTFLRPLAGIATKLGPLFGSLLGLAAKAGVIGILVTVFGALIANLNQVGSRLKPILDAIWKNLQEIGKMFMQIFTSEAGQNVAGLLMQAVEILTQIVGGIVVIVNKLIGGEEAGSIHQINRSEQAEQNRTERAYYFNLYKGEKAAKAAAKQIWYGPLVAEREAAKKAAELKKKEALKKASDKTDGGVNLNQDFRGSRFDITQAFSEGFDPDRVALAFSNELGSLGERQLQSGFSPLFGIR